MSADVYTKAFTTPDLWGRAARLINVFKPDELTSAFLSAWVTERHELGRSESVKETREFIIGKNAQVRDAARERGRMIPAAAKSAPQPSQRVGRKAVRSQAAPAADLFLALPAVPENGTDECFPRSDKQDTFMLPNFDDMPLFFNE